MTDTDGNPQTGEVLRCVARWNGRDAGQCPAAADWQCLRCGLGYCHRHAFYHRRNQTREPRPGPAAAGRQIGLARLLLDANSVPPPD